MEKNKATSFFLKDGAPFCYCAYCASRVWAPFLKTPDNVPSPKTSLCALHSSIVMHFLLILKAKF